MGQNDAAGRSAEPLRVTHAPAGRGPLSNDRKASTHSLVTSENLPSVGGHSRTLAQASVSP